MLLPVYRLRNWALPFVTTGARAKDGWRINWNLCTLNSQHIILALLQKSLARLDYLSDSLRWSLTTSGQFATISVRKLIMNIDTALCSCASMEKPMGLQGSLPCIYDPMSILHGALPSAELPGKGALYNHRCAHSACRHSSSTPVEGLPPLPRKLGGLFCLELTGWNFSTTQIWLNGLCWTELSL